MGEFVFACPVTRRAAEDAAEGPVKRGFDFQHGVFATDDFADIGAIGFVTAFHTEHCCSISGAGPCYCGISCSASRMKF